MNRATAERKVLPFDTPAGRVPGHALTLHECNGSYVERVEFRRFDAVARVETTVSVQVNDFTQWVKHDPCGGLGLCAVVLLNGQRIHATALCAAGHQSNAADHRAPLLCRGVFGATALGSGSMLLEVTGVHAWAWGQRRPEDAALILDPWARDNAAFNARFPHLAAQEAART